MLYYTSNHPAHVRPSKSEFLEALQKYFEGRVGCEITLERVCFRTFICNWSGEISPTQLGCGAPEFRDSRSGFAETPNTAYLTQ